MRKLRTEVEELWNSGFSGYFGLGGAFMFENVCSLVHCSAVICAIVTRAQHLGQDNRMEDLFLALASFTHWLYLAWFMLGMGVGLCCACCLCVGSLEVCCL